jgi:hypothetical protein
MGLPPQTANIARLQFTKHVSISPERRPHFGKLGQFVGAICSVCDPVHLQLPHRVGVGAPAMAATGTTVYWTRWGRAGIWGHFADLALMTRTAESTSVVPPWYRRNGSRLVVAASRRNWTAIGQYVAVLVRSYHLSPSWVK